MIQNTSQLIAMAESGNNLMALRFEPDFIPSSPAIQSAVTANLCSFQTGKMICQTSWGLFQIMGENLYSLGFRGSVGHYLSDRDTQTEMFIKFLDWKGINFSLDELKNDPQKLKTFASKYNGDAQRYSAYLIGLWS